MTERRRVETAMELTAEQRAFIECGTSGPHGKKASENVAETEPAVPESQLTRQAGQSTAEGLGQTDPFSSRRLLVPLTTRLQAKTAHLLRRAILQQRLEGRVPSTVQEIVEASVTRWLHDHGFWFEE
jgi:hypothetical protein